MSAPDGHEPPQVPHWMHMSRRQLPGVAATTSSRKLPGADTRLARGGDVANVFLL